jgi:hypothetical protein
MGIEPFGLGYHLLYNFNFALA